MINKYKLQINILLFASIFALSLAYIGQYFFNFIINKNPVDDFKINDLENIKTIFGGKNLTDIVNAEQKSTIDILLSNNSPLRLFEMTEISEESVSGLMMQMFLEAILIARVKNINPFDQPAVEKRKILSKKYINND